MSYARQAAMAGAVVLGFALNVRAQEPSKDDAPPPKTASPSDAAPKSVRLTPRQNRTGTRGDAPPSTGERDDQKLGASDKPASRDESQRHEPIAPDARVIQFSFATQPWENVLEWIADLAGMSLQMEVKPTGTFSYINDPNKYTLGQAMDILNVQLIAKGHILLRKGNYLKVIAFKDGPIPPDLIRRVKPEELDNCGDSEYVSVILPLKDISAKSAAEEIKSFVSDVGGKIVPLESVNRLMITDLVSNIRLMRDYLMQVEEQGVGTQARYRVFPLKFASAARVEANLREIFGLPPRQTSDSSSRSRGSDRSNEDPRERFRRMMESGPGAFNPFGQMFTGGPQGFDPRGGDSRGGDSRGDRSAEGRDRTSQESRTNNVTTSVDEPHNQVFIMAPPDKLAIAEKFIKDVDVPRPGQSDEWKLREPQVPTIAMYRLSDGDAQSLVTALTALFQNTPGVRFSADQSNNAVVAVATPDDQETIKTMVEQFERDERDSVVLSLTVLDATTVADLLGNVYASGQTDWRGRATPRPGQPRVVADRSRNQIMVRGSKKQVDDIRAMLSALGEPVAQFAGTEKLRRIPLNGANSKAIRELLEQMWPQISPNNNPIRIIEVGKKPDTERAGSLDPERSVPSGYERRMDDRRAPPLDGDSDSRNPRREAPDATTPGSNRTSLGSKSAVRLVSYEAPHESPTETDESVPKKETAQETGQLGDSQKDGAPVVVSIGPDSLVVASDDPAAVQRFMDLISSVVRGGSSGSEYTVFYLKSAEATALQQTLNEILGVSTVTSFFGGSNSSSQSSPLVKIVPDTRTNSLIVFGSANEVNRIEQLVRVLDRDDAPSSGALSAPRIVPVRSANATAVARVIRDVYATRITGGTGGTGGFPGSLGAGPFAGGPFGSIGGTSSNRSSRSGSGTLSVGVDEQSNSIVVSCSESLFQEVKKLVDTLDKAASETQRSVQIVTVKNSTPTAVQDALNGLMGITRAGTNGRDLSGRSYGAFPQYNTGTIGVPYGGGFPGGGFPGGAMPLGNPFFNRGGDSGGFDRSRFLDGGRGGFDGGRGGPPFGGNFGGDRRP